MNIRRPTDIRKKQNRRDSKKKYFIAGGGVVFLLVIVGLFIGIRESSLFRINAISVTGIPEMYGAQVRSSLEDFSREHSTVFRFLGADNMIAWDSTPNAFLDANPQFKDIHIAKDYVRKSIVIIVDGREKFGVWCRVAGQIGTSSEDADIDILPDGALQNVSEDECYWFDRDGVLFSRAPQVKSELFNRVYDSTGRTLGLRDKILPDRLFINLAKVFKLMEIAQINTKTVFVRDLALEEVDADSVSDPQVIFSLRSDPSFSLSAINALKTSGEWSKLQYANFTVENRVSYR